MEEKPKRRLSFSLRAIFAIVAFASISMGWWLDHRQQAARINALEKRFKRLTDLGYDIPGVVDPDPSIPLAPPGSAGAANGSLAVPLKKSSDSSIDDPN